MDRALRAYLAELVGTGCLVFFCAATACVAHVNLPAGAPRIGLVGLAVAQGAALAVLLSATTLVSDACLNPAVTLTLWVTKRYDAGRTLALIAVQLLGAILGGALVLAFFGQTVLAAARVGTPHLRSWPDVTLGSLVAGIALEAAFTFLLTLAIFATVIDPRRPRLGGLIPGLALAVCVLAGHHLTGAAANPARWLGPAVWQQTVPTLRTQPGFADHAAYWMGPVVGALAAGIIYTGVLLPPQPGERDVSK